jgi:ABC-type transport system involved in multi-copper enzyme maturation permease subunit
MTQTLALLLDAYRELNARKMFWITLILSGMCVVAFALFGVNAKGFTFLGMTLTAPGAQFWYKWVFSVFVIGVWAKWAALILALISTASIFPELIASGSIDLYLSKPISRLRLFLTKYIGGLLFVVLQMSVFAIGCYLVFGIRGHEWRPSLFLMIPLVVLLYSYLFCVCVLVGVMTRSTIAAILLTVLFWFICFGVNAAESGLYTFRAMQTTQARVYERELQRVDRQLQQLKARPSFLGFSESRLHNRREEVQRQAEEARRTAKKLDTFYKFAYAAATVVPKTGETVDLLDRKLFNDSDIAMMRERQNGGNGGALGEPPEEPVEYPATTTGPATNLSDAAARAEDNARDRELRREVTIEATDAATRAARARSVPWIIGTSLGFELVILAWGAWVFCRRDY